MRRIAILSHWHTGSSLLAHQFHLAGMKVGNKKTGWDDSCKAQCEHGTLNRLGDQLLLGKIDEKTLWEQASQILSAYNLQAAEHNWTHFGVKITHALQSKCWSVFKDLFDSFWPNTHFVTTVRHPLAIVASTANDPKWTKQAIVNSIADCQEATDWIINNGVAIIYPTSWITGFVERVVLELGLQWSQKIWSIFDKTRMRTFSEIDLVDFLQKTQENE